MAIIKEIGCVGHVFSFNDDDDTAIAAIEYVKKQAPGNSNIVFANGGDRTKENIPEMVFDDVEFVFGVGGEDKKNSSSWILNEWDKPTTQRLWGTYRDLDQNGHWKVKELSIDINKSLSDQRHYIRSEHWHIVDGELRMDLQFQNGYSTSKVYTTGDSIDIPPKTWHHAMNVGDRPVKVIEVWMGDRLSEEDIERRNN
jgi:mannose-6-phosphate isomerase